MKFPVFDFQMDSNYLLSLMSNSHLTRWVLLFPFTDKETDIKKSNVPQVTKRCHVPTPGLADPRAKGREPSSQWHSLELSVLVQVAKDIFNGMWTLSHSI